MFSFHRRKDHWDKKISQIARPRKKVAIVIPGTSREQLSNDEEISFKQLKKHLPDFDTFYLLPTGSNAELPDTRNIHFPRKYFGSALRHCHLLFRESFYKRFEDYEYIFFYHLDALVFDRNLLEWCEQGFDFIGAPWFPCDETRWVNEPLVGNGGFALLRVSSALKTIYNRYKAEPIYHFLDTFGSLIFHFNHYWRKVFGDKYPRYLRRFQYYENETARNDLFWSQHAPQYYTDFKIADVQTALKFAFEVDPSICYERNHYNLPFGCHAWSRYDREFWIEKMNK